MAEQLKIYASLTMLLLFSTWFVFTIDPEDIKKVPVSIDSPDYYMNTFITTSFSETGKIEKQLSARRLAHYPYDDRSEFTSVYISTTNPDNTIWELTAEKGKAFSSTKAIHLQGDINISEVSQSSSLNVQTETLDIDYNKNTAKTDDRVLISDTYGTVSAEGMLFDFGNHELTLTAKVRGKYYPSKTHQQDGRTQKTNSQKTNIQKRINLEIKQKLLNNPTTPRK